MDGGQKDKYAHIISTQNLFSIINYQVLKREPFLLLIDYLIFRLFLVIILNQLQKKLYLFT